ncbi:hypothetical protein SAMN05880590_101816 [Rhizobium sp. RU35A]|uniref:Flagellar FliJ protein n=1 Tax=Rhizobium straminoryzae TaxID=1387186 RepID=A0A549TII7_9HYPH|nr:MULTISPECIES: hypothetical protein [Rhizobium]TRL43027.1 hypothetical protein FNA46_01025 [Rhizobium straminoryzae]SIQ02142.1 hypothetical protein SAMN05880590_101816 [Rhizobium sp. RU35A]
MADSGQVRSRKLKRLVAVQRHLEKMAESELSAVTRQRAEVGEQMDLVIEAIGSMTPLHMQFSRHHSERFGRLMIRDSQLGGVQQVLEAQVLRERTKGDRLEEHMKEARSLEDREQDDSTLYDLLDLTMAGAKRENSEPL